MLIFSMQSKIKKNFDFLYNNDIIIEDPLKNILNKIKNNLIQNNKKITSNNISKKINYIISSNFKVFDDNLKLNNKEYNNYDKIIDIIKKNKKINISSISDQDYSINIFNHLVQIIISKEHLKKKSIIIPIDFCTYFSPRDNIYYLIIEYLKHLKPIEDENSNMKLNSIFKFNPKYPYFYKGKILYRDNNCLKHGYVNISSTLEDIFLSKNKRYEYNNTFNDLMNNDIVFNIDIYNKDNTNLHVDEINCRYHDNNFTFTSLNNINIYFFGNIYTEAYDFDYYTADEICNNVDVFLKYINNELVPNLGYFNYVKDTRKNMIKSYSYSFGTVKNKVKYDIELVTFYMKKYRKIMNKCILNRISILIYCLKQHNLILPVELWYIICSYFDIIPNINIE